MELHGGIVLVSHGRESDEVTAAVGFIEVQSQYAAQELFSKLSGYEMIGLHSIRILLVSDDCPCHDFATFGIYLASPPTESNVNIEEEGASIVFGSIMKNLCKESMSFPTEAKKHDKSEKVKVLEGLQRKSIPSALRIEQCAKCEAYPTLEEFLDIYHSPIYLELESEKMSPLVHDIDWNRVHEIASSYLTHKQGAN